jgi:hypothetical protein
MHQVVARMAERPPAYLSVASAFMMHFNDSDGKAYSSLETITKLCGLARRTVRDTVELLLADDNIRIVDKGEAGRGHPTIYAVVIKPLPTTSPRRAGVLPCAKIAGSATTANYPMWVISASMPAR